MYKAKYRLSKTMYIAEVNGHLVVVKTDTKGKIVKVVIFGQEKKRIRT